MCIETTSKSMPYAGQTIQTNCVKRSTMDLCIAIWQRVGIRPFTASEVKDLIISPSQLSAMKNRGYLVKRGTTKELTQSGQTYSMTVWQMTPAAMRLAEMHG